MLIHRYETERLQGELSDAKESLVEEQAAKDLLNETISRLTAEVDTLQTELAVARADAAKAAAAGPATAAAVAVENHAVRDLEALLEARNKDVADANDRYV